jgi:hypothetical protein
MAQWLPSVDPMSRSRSRPSPKPQPPSVVEILDRVLDRGVVIIATVGVSLVGVRLIDLDARVVVSSIDTYVARADVIEAAAYARPIPRAPRELEPEPSREPRARSRVRQGIARKSRKTVVRRRVWPLPDTVRCPDGCTFARDAITTGTGNGAMVDCPYRRGARCPVV